MTASMKLDFNVKDAQKGLRALTLMNVVGEAQILQNINLLSAAKQCIWAPDQENFSAQSWGSTLPDADTVKYVSAEGRSLFGQPDAAMCPVSGVVVAQGCSLVEITRLVMRLRLLTPRFPKPPARRLM